MPRKQAKIYFPGWAKLDETNMEKVSDIIGQITDGKSIETFSKKIGVSKSTLYRVSRKEIKNLSQELIFSILSGVDDQDERTKYQKELLSACGYYDFSNREKKAQGYRLRHDQIVDKQKKAVSYYYLSKGFTVTIMDGIDIFSVDEAMFDYKPDFIIETDANKSRGLDKIAVFCGPFYRGSERTLFEFMALTLIDKFGKRGYGLLFIEENRRKFNNVKELYQDINISEYIAVANISKDGDVKEIFNIPTESAVEQI